MGVDGRNMVKKCGFTFRTLIFLHQVSHGLILWSVLIPYHYGKGSLGEWVSSALVIVLTPMLVITHCITSSTRSVTFNRQRDKQFLNKREGAKYHTCEKCIEGQWKPFRSKHCSTQGQDVTRFDHFCPVTLNTIGYRNHAIFIKTAYLHMIMSAFWLYHFVGYLINHLAVPKAYSSTTDFVFVMVVCMLDTLFVVMICCMSIGISLSHTWFAVINSTTIEQIANNRSSMLNRDFGSFHLGYLFNIQAYFPRPLYLCCCPLPNDHKYEGYYFPQIGISREQFILAALRTEEHVLPQGSVKIEDGDIDAKGKEIYKEYRYKYSDHTYTIPS